MFELVPITKADYQAWRTLWDGYLEFYQADISEEITKETFERILSGGIHGRLAKTESGEAVGLVHWLTHKSTWSIPEVCYLEDLFVAKSARGQGIGKALIENVFHWAKENGSNKVYWLTAETNLTARKLYDQIATRTGFIHYEIRGD